MKHDLGNDIYIESDGAGGFMLTMRTSVDPDEPSQEIYLDPDTLDSLITFLYTMRII